MIKNIDKKIISFIIIIVIIISSFSLLCCNGNSNDKNNTIIPDNNFNQDNNTKINNAQNNTNITYDFSEQFSRSVFIEKGTATWCGYCPPISEILSELYEENHNFNYVTLIEDYSKSKKYLEDFYNIYAYPTVYIDGGYDVVVGTEDKSYFKNQISKAYQRDVPELNINVTSNIREKSTELKVSVNINNLENTTQNAKLKIYLTENYSRFYDADGNPYRFGFLDYIAKEEIEISAKDKKIINKTYDIESLDPTNLVVFAVLTDINKHQAYSDDNDDDDYPFNAYYCINSNSTNVVQQGNKPPVVSLDTPIKKRVYIFGRQIFIRQLKDIPILFGRTKIKINAFDDIEIEKIDIEIKGKFRNWKETITNEPYEYLWKKLSFGKYQLKITAYDNEDKSTELNTEVFAFIL